MKVVKLKTTSDHKTESVKEILEQALSEADSFEEIIILAKPKSKDHDYHWSYSELSDNFWWIGFLSYMKHVLQVIQEEGIDFGD